MAKMQGIKIRRSKFGNMPTNYRGIHFKSKLEARTAMLLDRWLSLGIVQEWEYEPQAFNFEHTDKNGNRK